MGYTIYIRPSILSAISPSLLSAYTPSAYIPLAPISKVPWAFPVTRLVSAAWRQAAALAKQNAIPHTQCQGLCFAALCGVSINVPPRPGAIADAALVPTCCSYVMFTNFFAQLGAVRVEGGRRGAASL